MLLKLCYIIIRSCTVVVALLFCVESNAQNFSILSSKDKVTIVYHQQSAKLDSILAHTLAKDIFAITGYQPQILKSLAQAKGNIIVLEGAKNPSYFKQSNANQIKNQWEVFSIQTLEKPSSNIKKAILITGSDARGLAYGVFHLSEKMGINPWYDWADVHPEKKKKMSVSIKDTISKTPSVKYRGIFLNDEDWGLRPWAASQIDKEIKNMGPKTYAKIFELLLRLKANMIWPAMHPGTKAFFNIPENLAVAKDYEIVVGSSHAEPMLRNNVDEWKEDSLGAFNYVTNKKSISNYWKGRIKDAQGLQAIFTLGIRGVHDSGMEGVKNNKEAAAVLQTVFNDQREMLKSELKQEITKIPQALTLYKEVLDIYDEGLKVPEDVTLVWPDDNYGYIRRLGNAEENKRIGGGGVYYHVSYWGRPHDYLWLNSTPPALLYQEMLKAYVNEAKNMWVVNVGDIKPAEYQTQLFLDMAYDIEPFKNQAYLSYHTQQFYSRIFKTVPIEKLASIIQKYYHLALERKPEYMGWSQTEPTTQTQLTKYNHFAYGDEAQKRIDNYQNLEKEVEQIKKQIPVQMLDAFFQLVEYPVIGASNMSKKFLYHDKSILYASQGRLSAKNYRDSMMMAYENIQKSTLYYNSTLSKGKWAGMMSCEPRKLPVYALPKTDLEIVFQKTLWNISIEGDANLDIDTLTAPIFYGKADEQFFIDIFLQQDIKLDWELLSSSKWVKFSKNQGSINASQNQYRIWVKPDISQLPSTNEIAYINIKTNQGNKVIMLNYQKQEKVRNDVFKEQNDYVSIYASNYSAKLSDKWELVDGLGYSGKVMSSTYMNLENLTIKDSSILSYDFINTTEANPTVHIFTIPTHPLNNLYSLKYAVRIDGGIWQVKDFATKGRSNEWKENVLSNISEQEVLFNTLKPGKHKLQILAIDPGVMIDRFIIDMGKWKPAYSILKETK